MKKTITSNFIAIDRKDERGTLWQQAQISELI